jgi:hypothetical protein
MFDEMAEGFSNLAWYESGLTTQTVKNKICAHPSSRRGWTHYMKSTPRNITAELPIHEIPDRSELMDPDNGRSCPPDDMINIMGTPLGIPLFVSTYLQGKGLK